LKRWEQNKIAEVEHDYDDNKHVGWQTSTLSR
jgi:hypothetical protein